jgi:hypothetical protein
MQCSTLIRHLIITSLFSLNSCVWYACFLHFIFLALHVWYIPHPFTLYALRGTDFRVRAVKACRGIIPVIYNLGTRWMWVTNFTFLLTAPLERTVVPIEYKAWCAPELIWTFWRKGKISSCCQDFNPRFSILQPCHYADYTIVAVYMACHVCLEFDAKVITNWAGFCVDWQPYTANCSCSGYTQVSTVCLHTDSSHQPNQTVVEHWILPSVLHNVFPKKTNYVVAVSFSLKCSQSLMESAFVVISNTERYGKLWILL